MTTKFKGSIIFEQKPDKDSLAAHAVRIRHNGAVAKTANIKRGDIVQIKVNHSKSDTKTIYRVAVFSPLLKAQHIRMSYDNLIEVKAEKLSAFKSREGVPLDVSVKAMNNPIGKALFLWLHPDPNMRFAVHSFIYSIVLGITIDISLSLFSIAMTT